MGCLVAIAVRGFTGGMAKREAARRVRNSLNVTDRLAHVAGVIQKTFPDNPLLR
jgi:hypothetical protein